MKEDIVKNISNALNGDIRDMYDEPNVLYILIEIRKFLEQENVKDFYLLKFMSNWVVHSSLDRKHTKELLLELEENINSKGFTQNNFGFISFLNLKTELNLFLKNNNITINKFNDNWIEFKNSLINIIIDCPLENKSGKIIRKFTITINSEGKYGYQAEIVPGSLSHLGLHFSGIKLLKGNLM